MGEDAERSGTTDDATAGARLRRECRLLREALSESEQKLQEKIEEISLLRLIVDLETVMLDAQDPYEVVLTQVVNLTGAENGSIMLMDPALNSLVLKCAGGIPRAFSHPHVGFRPGEGIAGHVVESGEAMLIGDVSEEPSFVQSSEPQPPIRSLYCFPLKADGAVLGVINISHSRPFAFTHETCRVLHIISRYLAMALRSATLLETQREYLRRIEASESRYRTLVESVNDGFFILDGNGRTSLVNGQLCAMTGYDQEEMLALPDWSPIVHPADWERVSAILDEYRNGGGGVEHSFDFVLMDRRGREVPVHVRSRQARLEAGACCIGIIRDMTEYRSLQSQLLHSEKLASLGTLLTGITHELNNKLTPILGYAQLLQQRSELSDREMEHVRAIEACGTGAKAIVDSLLGFARRSSLTREEVPLDEIVREVLVVSRPMLAHCGVTLKLQLDGTPRRCFGTPHQLEQVVMNIVNNAIQAMEPRGGGVLTVASGGDAGSLWVSIADTGPGISDEIISRIFDPFFTTKSGRKGTGLGLSVSYGIIKAHGGDLSVETVPGQGARFIITLPAVCADNHGGSSTHAPASEMQLVASSRILVVDDEEFIGVLLGEMLSGHTVRIATDGRTAQQYIAQDVFDLILLDMRMPILDGAALYRWILERDPALAAKVIFTTGDTYDPETERFLAECGRPCIAKPFTIHELTAAVNECLRASS